MAKSYSEIKKQVQSGKYVSNNPTTAKKKKTYAEIKASLSDYDFGVDSDYIKSFYEDLEKYQTDTSNSYNGINYNNYAKTVAENESRRKDLKNRASNIRAYLGSRKGKIDEKSYASMIDSLNAFDEYSSNVWRASESVKKEYSPFESEDDYNRNKIGWLQDDDEISPEKAKARKDYYNSNVNKISDLDSQIKEKQKELLNIGGAWFWETDKRDAINQKKEELSKLTKQRDAIKADNKTYDRTQRNRDQYFDVTEQANFETDSQDRNYINPTEVELKQYDSDNANWEADFSNGMWHYDDEGNVVNEKGEIMPQQPNAPEIKDKLGLYLSTSKEDVKRAYGELSASNGNTTNTWANVMQEGESNRWHLLKDTEIGIYYTLLKNNGQESAYKFLDDMAFELTQREKRETKKLYDGSNALEKIALSLATVPVKAVSNVIGFADDVSNLITEGEINPYSPAHRGSNFTNVIRSERAEDYNEAFGNAKIPWLGFDAGQVYQSGMSMLDSVVGGKIFGSGYSAVMGMGAASDEAQRLYEQGASTLQATTGGFLAGAAETLFEYISLEHFLNLKTPTRKLEIIKQALAQGGVEASEEIFTEVANTLTNAIVMGSQSDWQSYRDKYIKLGYTDAQATVKALFNDVAPNVINAGIGGFLSGGAMGGAKSAINYGLYNVEATRTGKVIAQNNNTSKLVEQAKNLPNIKENNYLRKLADKVASDGSDSRGYYNKIGKLYDGVQEAQIKQFNNSDKQAFKESVRAELKNKGIENLDEATEIVTKAYFGQLSSKEAKIFDSVGGKEILNTVMNSKDLDNAKTSTKISNFVNMASTNQLVSATNAESRVVDADINVDDRISDEGKTIDIATGKEVSIKAIASIKDGKMTLKLNDGTVVDSADIEYGSKEEALVYETVLNLGVSHTIGNNIIKAANSSNMPVESFMKNVILAYDYGITNESSRLGSIALPKNIKNFMFQTGREYAQKHSEEMLKEAKDRVVKGKATNKVTYVNKIEGKLNGKQKAMIHVAEFFANATSLDINVFQSYRKGVNVYANINGVERETSANGWFVEGTNKIYIDINSGSNFDGLGLFTLAHESGHFIRSWNATEWQTMADVIVDIIDKQAKADSSNPTFEELLAKKYNKYQQNRKKEETLIKEGKLKKEHADYAGRSDSKLRDMAYEDVICDSLESLMADKETFVEFSKQLDKKDHKLWVKLKEFIKNFLDELDEWLKSYSGVNTEDEAGKAIQNAIKEDRDRIRELYVSAFLGANENYSKAVERGMALDTGSVKVTNDGAIILQQRQYKETGRQTLYDYLEGKYGKQDAEDLIGHIDKIYQVMEDIKSENKGLSVFSNWQTTEIELDEYGKPIFTTSINNGEYDLNQDFSRVCKKRRQLDFVLNMLAEDPEFRAEYLTKQDFVNINKAIKKHRFEIACALCFVDSKRFRQAEWADSFANTWNDILDSVMVKGSNPSVFNFATNKVNINDEGIQIDLTKPVSFRKWEDGKVKETRKYKNINDLIENEGNNQVIQMARIIRDNPSLRHTFRGADIISSQGFDKIQRLAPDIRGILDGWGGTSVPKPSSMDTSYDNSILNLDNYNKEKAYAMGGVRMQSFSDFMAHMFFDYCQAFADLSAKELPMQSYTKELTFARLFGKLGGKINMSGIAAVRENALPMKEGKGLTKAQAEANKAIEMLFAGLDVDGICERLGKDVSELTEEDIESCLDLAEYVWADESIDMTKATLLQSGILYDELSDSKQMECYELLKEGKFDEAFKVAGKENVDKEYAKNIGTIVVGVSDAHIRKLLRDSTVRMVIPYHKSGINANVAKELKIYAYNDYTSVQTTGVEVKDTKRKGIANSDIQKRYGIKDFDFYEFFGKEIDGVFYDGKATAEKYLDWCENGFYDKDVGDYVYYKKGSKKGEKPYILASDFHKTARIVPKFDKFTNEENYYKVLEDFDVYDTITGEHSPQGAVDFFGKGLPEGYKGLLVEALKEEQSVHDEFRDHLNNKGLKDEIMDIVKKKNGYNPLNINEWNKTHTQTEAERKSDKYDLRLNSDRVTSNEDYIANGKNYGNALEYLTDKLVNGVEGKDFITVYRSFQVINGGLYAPMNAVDRDEDGKNHRLGFRSKIGVIEKATESPTIAQAYMDKHPDAPYAKFNLDGVDNATSGVAYNPYLHASNLVMNDQFSAAYRRNLVTVECRVPISEIGAYKAQYAKDATGWVEWKPGGTSLKLAKAKPEYTRKLFVSRYMLPYRILDYSEVANIYKEYLDGTNIKVPWNVVGSDLRNALIKAGVPIDYKDYVVKNKSYGEKVYKYDEHKDDSHLDLNTIEGFNSENDDIRYNERDSEGNTLSEGQQEYFKDSKVRDADGNLLIMYHGTKSKFTVFERDKIGSTGRMEGSGFNFTPSKSRASSYSDGTVLGGYLKIVNPISADKKTLTIRQIADIIREIDPTGDNIISNYAYETRDYGKKSFINRESLTTAKAIFEFCDNDADIYAEMSSANPDAESIIEKFKSLGYDGVIHYNNDGSIMTAVTFDSEQFKNADNLNPTYDSDIRYQDRNLDATDNRTLLSNALASTAQNEIEKKYIEQYQEKIDAINAEQKKLTELRAKIKELSFAKGHRDANQIRKLQDEATKTANRINTFDKQLLRLESAKPLKEVLNREKTLAKKKAEKAGREALNAYKERAAKTQQELMDRYTERIKKGKERRDMTELRYKIKKIADDFKQSLLNGSDTRYVPKNLVEGIISVCNEIDPTGKDQNTKVAEKYRSGKAALAELKLAYDSLKTEDYEFSSEFNEEFSKNIEDLAKTVGDTPLRDMSKDQLEDVYNIIHDIKAMLQDATKQIGTSEKISNYEAGQELIALMQGIKGLGLTTNEISSFFRNWMENPMRAVREMSAFNPDSRLVKLFNALNEGRRKMDTFRMEANKEFDELRSTKEGEKNFNDAVEMAHDFGLTDINGNPLKISKMQAMQLVLTWNREQANENRKHLQSGAIIPDVDLLRKGKFKEAFDNGQQIGMVTPEVITKIMDGLSEWDKQYMETARKFFNGEAKDAVNETSMITRHRIIASEKEYIPYEVNKDYVSKDSDNVKFDATIEGMGMLKSVKNNAPQMLVMGGLNSILADHIDNVGKLYGLSVPIRNWNKVFNMRQTDADGGMSVKAAIRNTWKDAGVNLLDQAVADLQTPRRHDSVKLLSTIKSAQVASTLASNISVWMKQAASYPTAGAVLSQKALTKGLIDYITKIKDGIHAQDVWDEIDAHTSQHWIRRQGLSMQELGDFNQSKGWLNKVNKKLGKASPMNWIQAMDVATTAALWYACKSEVDSTGVSKGSDEYWEAVTELYDKVIEETQPMYDSLHRAEITKKDQLKNFIMFQTQPLQNSGILREGAMEYKMAKKQYGKDSKVTNQAGKKFRMAVGSQMASHFVFTAMTLIAGMLLHKMNPWRDDDDELTAESVAENFAIQFSKNYFNAIVPIIGNYATSLCEVLIGGSRNEVITDFTVDRINTTINTFAKLKEPTFENFANAFCEVASYFGIPASNAKNIVNGVILHVQDAMNGEFGSFEAGVDRATGQEVSRMYSAYESGDTAKMKSILNELIQEKIDSGKDEKEAKSAIRASITSKYKPIFLKAYSKNDTVRMAQTRKFLNATGIYDDVVETTQNWIKQSKQSK